MAAVGCQQWRGEHASPTTQARAQSNTDVFTDTNPRTTVDLRDNNKHTLPTSPVVTSPQVQHQS